MKILVVDDIVFSLALLRKELNLMGHEITAIEDPYEAVDELKYNNSYDVVLCDYNMPDLNGIDFYNECLKKIGTLTNKKLPPFILYSAHTSQKIIKSAQNAGFMDTLEKPVCRDKLEQLLKKSCKKSLKKRTRLPKVLIYATDDTLQKQLEEYIPPNSCKFVTITTPFQALTYYKNNADIVALVSYHSHSPISSLTFFNFCRQNKRYNDHGEMPAPECILFMSNNCRSNINETIEIVKKAREMGIQNIFETPLQQRSIENFAETIGVDTEKEYDEVAEDEFVLLVDSITFSRALTKKALTNAGYAVKDVSSGEEALDEFAKNANYSAVITTSGLNDMSGLAFYTEWQKLAELTPNSEQYLKNDPFIMLYRENEEPPKGAIRSLKRPFDDVSLVTLINQITLKDKPKLLEDIKPEGLLNNWL